ncbi:arabinan endo-1,5-alpha-L-arabinosidase [Flavilitoribacter nigricans]|uniref:Arabinan endo-1,5-alpha-L-arabinosidase n=1 Tax=Flavilitoribacter nigricans (strain ATCC 23147 / DSM 23189 / NBRC 102662 / NCIMB 1420 / SS-2) TaxID=1122177 RepID=A0A2D0NIR4_FLAN2|nr:arabinan endo-1,5-alpha-L-arabinosidase [Flavilitoribacter nigricans]PHN08395.1 arabinan endo-1,5-alpha-L-arabinosidase [Flavilitoribacter nigricans DSM 23189 = NBRC 102662]
MCKLPVFRLLLAIICLFAVGSTRAQSDIRVHDPVAIRQGDTYYLFCTGRGISVWSSPDLENWTKQAAVFEHAPDWTQSIVPGFRNHIWAPDISYHDGQYYLYYSISAFGKNTSAIGVATNATLDPESPDFKWQDHGMVIQSIPNRDLWNAIDPNLAVDEEGAAWLSFGSFWGGLKLFKLADNRLQPAQPQEWHTIAKRERDPLEEDDRAGQAALEAPFIFQKNGYYYLFASYDYCCRGAESTYKVKVGRSKDIRGPYLDKDGNRMDQGGGSIVLEGNEQWPGLGHNSIYTFDGQDYFIFHAYDMQDNGRPKLKISTVGWDEDGWPVVDQRGLVTR